MCDFRIIEKIVLEDGTVVDTSDYIKEPFSKLYDEEFKPEKPNLHYFYATGAKYLYWDGGEWTSEFTKYNYENWYDKEIGYKPKWKAIKWSYDNSYLYEIGGDIGCFKYNDEWVEFPKRLNSKNIY